MKLIQILLIHINLFEALRVSENLKLPTHTQFAFKPKFYRYVFLQILYKVAIPGLFLFSCSVPGMHVFSLILNNLLLIFSFIPMPVSQTVIIISTFCNIADMIIFPPLWVKLYSIGQQVSQNGT